MPLTANDSNAPIAHKAEGADPYAWLQERDTDAVLDYLKAENSYLDAQLAHQGPLRETLFQEIKGRILETDLSLPSPWGPYLYYTRTTAGDEYARHYRCPRPADDSLTVDESREQLLLDPNALANGGFFSLGAFSISPDHQRLAYSLDTTGEEIYTLFVKELASDKVSELSFDNCDGSMTWANDSLTLFFGELDDTHRPHKLLRYRLDGTAAEEVFHEPDGRFFLHCYRSSSERQLLLSLGSKTTGETWALDATQPQLPFTCLAPRVEGHEYDVDHGLLDGQWTWFIRSNRDGINFALYQAADNGAIPEQDDWQLLVPHNPEVMLDGVTLNAAAMTLSLREGGLPIIEVHPRDLPVYRVQLPDAAYSLHVQNSLEFSSERIRLRYEALNRPAQVRQLQLADGQQQVLKETPVLGPFDPEAYVSQRLWATAADGTQVPISLVVKRDCLGQPTPLYLYGYGAYGESLDPWFSHARLSLLDRGVAFAIAHVRGGGELGEAWYRAGKQEHKQNTFSDFIACAEHLIAQGLTSAQQLAISGGSAGGLLIGAVLNQRPELFKVAIAEVPFVDVLNTMLDPELPLTVTEYDEWGNPEEPEVYARIKAYAPYENVRAQAYPATLVIAGYNDSRVQYWEAAKWVARLRATRTDDNPLLLKTELGAGHGGMSGRYQGLRDVALEYAFILNILGLA
ncbi:MULTISPECIES: S9 family peptidase [unclassified Pseudomonas]|uniref:S9 family peptidase n=1 Tax=unclassified Pseudomonas TaxID=196821 RepID=UPI0008764D25|nr:MULTISPECIES: S9 family peptidase [unclassified Pseudomonas]SCZ68458.1 oligopeptidase B Serine peptidase. MEROPS family S09A [Pseudomonas sp. NFPP17]SDA62720.1 oligopeptidase B Serine peptidase. MEROPS family S09A [Pseudomonas sp. NFPP15]SEL16661.1 oligopeptidase B Serine peptidase. MEROPS family S09A [Pseudomonas sp. NFPP18]SFA62436.1 oligopeptidase B Serine peptidase. MEROPS family S09A [Pseudomonas sp. NFPP13]SFT82338.1 oligopeptidase B Serine peptidase. MEROPS family S09A [Pseudomonas s